MLPPWPTTLGHHRLNCGRGDSAWNLWERRAVPAVLESWIQTWLRVVLWLVSAYHSYLLAITFPIVHHLDPRITRRVSRTETTIRGDHPGETYESSDSADDHGQWWERCSSKQIDEHQIPSFRSAHGTGVIHAKDEPADGRRVGASRGKQRGGQARERWCRRFRPEHENRCQRQHAELGHSSRSPGIGKSSRTSVAGSPRKRHSPRQVQERQAKKTRRAFALEGSMVKRSRKKHHPADSQQRPTLDDGFCLSPVLLSYLVPRCSPPPRRLLLPLQVFPNFDRFLCSVSFEVFPIHELDGFFDQDSLVRDKLG